MFLFYLPRFTRASRRPITRVKFKFVARQVVTSVVIRAAKLEFVAENRTLSDFVHWIVGGNAVGRILSQNSLTLVYVRDIAINLSIIIGFRLYAGVITAVLSHTRPPTIFSHFENCILVDVNQTYP